MNTWKKKELGGLVTAFLGVVVLVMVIWNLFLDSELGLLSDNLQTVEEAVDWQRDQLGESEGEIILLMDSLKLARAQVTVLEEELASVPVVDPKWMEATQLDHQWTISSGNHLEALILQARDSAGGELRKLLNGVQTQLYEHREAQAHLTTSLRMQLSSVGVPGG